MFSPEIIAERVEGLLRNYDFIGRDTLAYFTPRLTQAPTDVAFALAYVREHADTAEKQALILDTLRFKCDVLWTQLDALYFLLCRTGSDPARCLRSPMTEIAALASRSFGRGRRRPAVRAACQVPVRRGAAVLGRASARAAVVARRAGRCNSAAN